MDIKIELLKQHILNAVIDNIKNLDINADTISDTTAVKILAEIQKYIVNDNISDFEVVEQIILLFEPFNIDCGNRHDFS